MCRFSKCKLPSSLLCTTGMSTQSFSKDRKVTFKQKSKIFDRLTSLRKYDFLIKHFEIIFSLIAYRISWNMKDIESICFKYLHENEFILPNYGNLIGNKFNLGQLSPHPFIRKTEAFELYWNHIIGIRQAPLSINDSRHIYDFHFKCNSKCIDNIYIGIIGSDKGISKIISNARKDKDELIFNDRNHSLSYYINIFCSNSSYKPRGSTIYSLEYGYPEEVFRNSWPIELNQNDIIHFKINACAKIISLFHNEKLVHSLKLADMDFQNVLFYPTISLPIVQNDIKQFEIKTDTLPCI